MSCSADYYIVFWSGSADTHLLAVEGVGGANADEGTDTIVLCILAHRTSPLNN